MLCGFVRFRTRPAVRQKEIIVLSVRPKVTELVFQLYGRSLHPELFNIYQSRTIRRGAYEATIQITSAGHLVTWNYQDRDNASATTS